MLDNREVSIVVWTAALILWALFHRGVRQALVPIGKTALNWKILVPIAALLAYVGFTVAGLWRLGFWDCAAHLKPTILWIFGSAFVMFGRAVTTTGEERFLERAFLAGLGTSLVLEFVVNLRVFSIWIELALVPTLSLLAAVLVVAESKEDYKPVAGCINSLLALAGFGVLGFVGYSVWNDFEAFARLETLIEFLLPVVLTFLFVPFLFAVAVAGTYERIFVRLRFFIRDPTLRRFTKIQLAMRFGPNYRGVNRWFRLLTQSNPTTREEVLDLVRKAKLKS